MHDLLKKLVSDTSNYRESVDKIFSVASQREGLHQCFSDILTRASELYLDYRLFMKYLPEFEAASVNRRGQPILGADIHREGALRERLRKELESSQQWALFRPDAPLSNLIGLRTSQDFLNNLGLHLPEIYEETFRIEDCVQAFLESHVNSALVQLMVGLQHLGRNHTLFLLPALEWAADEDNWEQV